MGRTALILGDDEKGLQPVFGVPAVRRCVLLALQLNMQIHVVSSKVSLFSVLSDLVRPDAFHLLPQGCRPALMVKELRLAEGEQVLLLKAHHVIDYWSLVRLFHDAESRPCCFLDRNGMMGPDAIFLAGAHDVTRFVTGPAFSLPRAFGADVRETEGTPGLPEVLDGGEAKVRLAEERLVAGLERATRGHDSFLAHHVSRLFSRIISPAVSRTRITPNMVTLFNTTLGLAGAFLLARGTYPFQVAGSLLFLLSVILDGVDGEVARLKLQASNFGHYLDVISDNVVHVAVFAGMGLGLHRQTNDVAYLYVMWLLLAGFGLCALAVHTIMAHADADTRARSRLIAVLEGMFNNRDFAYLVAGLALFHCLDWFLPATAAGTYLFACTLFVVNFRLKRRGGGEESGIAD